jgi:dynein heavy chain
MDFFFYFILKKNTQTLRDLDDVRSHMNALNQIKEREINIERTITPIEETYVMLNKYEIQFNDGNSERVDTLTYRWRTLNSKAKEVQDELMKVQPTFKTDLINKVIQFKRDAEQFSLDYKQKG